MKRLYHILLMSLIGLMASCSGEKIDNQTVEENPAGGGGYRPYLVSSYRQLTGLYAKGDCFVLQKDKNGRQIPCFNVTFDTKKVDEDQVAAWRKMEKEGSFLQSDAFPPVAVLLHSFQRIEIVSDQPFAEIAPGNTIGKYVRFYASSALPCLEAKDDSRCFDNVRKRGETVDYCSSFINYPFHERIAPVSALVSELKETDLSLLGTMNMVDVVFAFEMIPEIKEHVFTITFYEDTSSWRMDVPVVFP